MAADTAVTIKSQLPNGNVAYRVLTGVRKLQLIPKLKAGVSVWGEGTIRVNANTIIDTDLWLADFIDRNSPNYASLNDFASLLETELRQIIPPINIAQNPLGTIGFHLAGYVDYQGTPTPTFYHIHNGQSQTLASRGIAINPSIVNANHDLPPQIVIQNLSRGANLIIRNGDFIIYAQLFNHLTSFLQALASQSGITIPHSRTLRERAEWLEFQIKTMSELYTHSNRHLPTIGGKIDTLLINAAGVDVCGLSQ